jgi:hypothetical protein
MFERGPAHASEYKYGSDRLPRVHLFAASVFHKVKMIRIQFLVEKRRQTSAVTWTHKSDSSVLATCLIFTSRRPNGRFS